MMTERIYTIMTTEVVTLSPSDSLMKVKELIFGRRFHHLPVIDENRKLVGIVTSWDLLKADLKNDEYEGRTVSEVMSTKVATLHPNEMVGAAAMVFLRHLFHAIPIVEQDNTLVGIVTTHDVLVYEFQRENPDNKFIEETGWIRKWQTISETTQVRPPEAVQAGV